jgi:hypothetical protein
MAQRAEKPFCRWKVFDKSGKDAKPFTDKA